MKRFEFFPEELRQWQKDPKGEVFWQEIKDLRDYHVDLERASIRAGKITEATLAEGYAMAFSEVMNLVDNLISEKKKGA